MLLRPTPSSAWRLGQASDLPTKERDGGGPCAGEGARPPGKPSYRTTTHCGMMRKIRPRIQA